LNISLGGLIFHREKYTFMFDGYEQLYLQGVNRHFVLGIDKKNITCWRDSESIWRRSCSAEPEADMMVKFIYHAYDLYLLLPMLTLT